MSSLVVLVVRDTNVLLEVSFNCFVNWNTGKQRLYREASRKQRIEHFPKDGRDRKKC